MLQISDRIVANNAPTYIIAEISANHNQEFEQAVKLIEAAKEVGADAVKLQPCTPMSVK